MHLVSLYSDERDNQKLERLYLRAIKENPGNDWGYGALGLFYKNNGNQEAAQNYLKREDLRQILEFVLITRRGRMHGFFVYDPIMGKIMK